MIKKLPEFICKDLDLNRLFLYSKDMRFTNRA
jgi:hypothetical protein